VRGKDSVVAVTQKKVPVSNKLAHASKHRVDAWHHVSSADVDTVIFAQDKLIDPTSITHLFKVSSSGFLRSCKPLTNACCRRSFKYNTGLCCAQISKHIGMLATGMLGERALSALEQLLGVVCITRETSLFCTDIIA
jgi:hypothetical protein